MTGVGGLFFLRLRKGSAMTRRRTLYLPAVLVACMVAVLAVSKKAKATFSGQNGKITYVDYSGVLYTINAMGALRPKSPTPGLAASLSTTRPTARRSPTQGRWI
jgi:hypothetical protein